MKRFALPLLVLLAACGLVDLDGGVQEEPRVGVIAGFHTDDPRVDVPDSVQVATPFPVTMRTYGNGCVRRGGVEVEAGEDRVTLTPWDYVRFGETCSDELQTFEHEVVMQVEVAREVQVVVRGVRHPDGVSIEVEHIVVVH